MSRYPIYGLCWVCEQKGEEVKICGGYLAYLCPHHRNAWHEYASRVETVRAYLRAVTKIDYYVKVMASPNAVPVTQGLWMTAQKEAHDTGKKAFKIAERWVKNQRDHYLKFIKPTEA